MRAVRQSVGPSPAQHGDAMPGHGASGFSSEGVHAFATSDREPQAWIETACSRMASQCCVASTLANMSLKTLSADSSRFSAVIVQGAGTNHAAESQSRMTG